jgi:glutamate synthase domain-containing protein 3
MLRACHRDTCKPGIATQRPNLRANFAGTPEGVAAYFMFVAEEVRAMLATLGAHTLDDIVGRTELLRQRTSGDSRADMLDLSPLMAVTGTADAPRRFMQRTPLQDPRSELGDAIASSAFRPVWEGDHVVVDHTITNADRTVGTALGGAIAIEHASATPPGSVTVQLAGQAGQSLGAFITDGIDIRLCGEANDYVGKGMGGGRIVVVAPDDDLDASRSEPGHPPAVLAGNTCLYGATGGELFVAGAVGERFAVRNSGAVAVVEAAGDHCCEYMTGGTVVVLGRVGYNLGAGMTGGNAYVWDPEIDRLLARVNQDLVEVHRPHHRDLGELRWLVESFVAATESQRATRLLEHWATWSSQLWAVTPRSNTQRIGAGVARRVRADWKSRLAQGEASLPELLAAARVDPVLGAMRVADALGALPGLGPKGVERAMVDCSIASTRRLRGLGVRQQAALLARFPAGAGH